MFWRSVYLHLSLSSFCPPCLSPLHSLVNLHTLFFLTTIISYTPYNFYPKPSNFIWLLLIPTNCLALRLPVFLPPTTVLPLRHCCTFSFVLATHRLLTLASFLISTLLIYTFTFLLASFMYHSESSVLEDKEGTGLENVKGDQVSGILVLGHLV